MRLLRWIRNDADAIRLSFTTKAFLAVLFIVLLEGAMRKWLFLPGTPIMLMRDLVVGIAIIHGFRYGGYRMNAWPELFLFGWSFLILLWALAQSLTGLMPLPVVFVGFRFWVYYAWFALLFARVVTKDELFLVFKIILLTVVPMVVLAIVQYYSPVNSFINRQAEGNEKVFVVVYGIVRTTGTFSFTAGFTTYLAFISPLIFWLIADGARFFKSYLLRMSIIGAFFLGALVSGSRGTLAFVAGMGVIWFIAMIIKGSYPKLSSKTILLLPLLLVAGVYFLAPVIERAYSATTQRIETASNENLNERLVMMFFGSNQTWEEFSFFGHGIGAASNAGKQLMKGYSVEEHYFGEGGFDRMINAGGLMGILFYMIRIMIALAGSAIAFQIMMVHKNSLPFMFWTFLTLQLISSNIIGQITIHAFAFLSLGIGWALLKKSVRQSSIR